ncbi:MAG: SulP family inorganic anion transporter [bacterium]|nr:SulP family inorganic anion transporter [bacterium]
MTRYIPILGWLRDYKPEWFRADLVAGLTIMALLVPEGMAYAELAGVGPEAAFYAAPIGLLLYAAFGTSRQLVVAVSSAIAVMSASIVGQVGGADAAEFAALTAALALLAGVVGVLAGFLRLGRIARFFSGSVLAGFVSGLALVIIVKQLPKIFGLEGTEGNTWERLWHLLADLGEAHGTTLVVGVSTIVLMVALEHWFHRIPAALVALVYGIIVVTVFDLDVHVVGEIPSGLALPAVPDVSVADIRSLLPGAVAITLVMFAEAIGSARSFASSHRYQIDEDQELVGMGMANFGAGLFHGFPIGASLSKSAAADAAGGRSQVAGVIAAAATALVALFLTPLFENLPEAALGAIVIIAVSGMFKWKELRRFYRLRRTDFWLASIALLGVLTFEEVLSGLLVAVLASLVAFVMRTREARISELGRLPGTLQFRSLTYHPEALLTAGMLIARPDQTIFFANAASIREGIRDRVAQSERPVHTVLLDLELTSDLDIPATEMLEELQRELEGMGVSLILAGAHGPVEDLLNRSGLLRNLGEPVLFTTVVDAVLEFDEREGTELVAEDRDAIVTRLAELAELASRHSAELTKEDTSRLAEVVAQLKAFVSHLDE